MASFFDPMFGLEAMAQEQQDNDAPRQKLADLFVTSTIEPPDQYAERRVSELVFGPKGPTAGGKASLFLKNLLGAMAGGSKFKPIEVRAQERAMQEYELMQKNRAAEMSEQKANMMGQVAMQRDATARALGDEKNRLTGLMQKIIADRDAEKARSNKARELAKSIDQDIDRKELSVKDRAQRLAERKFELEELYGPTDDPEAQFFRTTINGKLKFLPEDVQRATEEAFNALMTRKAQGQVRVSERTAPSTASGIDPATGKLTMVQGPPITSRTVSGPAAAMGMMGSGQPTTADQAMPPQGPSQQQMAPPQPVQPQTAPPQPAPQPAQNTQPARPSPQAAPYSPQNISGQGTGRTAVQLGSPIDPKFMQFRTWVTPVYKSVPDQQAAEFRHNILTMSSNVAEMAVSQFESGSLQRSLSVLNRLFGEAGQATAEGVQGIPIVESLFPYEPGTSMLFGDVSRGRSSETYAFTGKQLNTNELIEGRQRWPGFRSSPDVFLSKALQATMFFRTYDWKHQLWSQGVDKRLLESFTTSQKIVDYTQKQISDWKAKRLSTPELLESLDPQKVFGDEFRKRLLDERGGAPAPSPRVTEQYGGSKPDENKTSSGSQWQTYEDDKGRTIRVRRK